MFRSNRFPGGTVSCYTRGTTEATDIYIYIYTGMPKQPNAVVKSRSRHAAATDGIFKTQIKIGFLRKIENQ